jgi:hypothetical protein
MRRAVNGLILGRVIVLADVLEDLHEKKGVLAAPKQLLEASGGAKSRHPSQGARRVLFVEEVQLESACRTTNQ